MGRIPRREFLATSAALLAGGCGKRPAASLEQPLPARPNFIVFLSDTLRADHLSCYGYPLATTPNIDATAATSVVFEECYAAATWTLPATASLLTGTHPLVHRTTVPEWTEEGIARGYQHQVLPDAIKTTAETLEAHGYTTAFFQANPNATGNRGLARGCQHRWSQVDANPDVHVDAVLDWIESEAVEPFYAYVHLIDPHEPYAASPDIFRDLHGKPMEDFLADLRQPERDQLKDYHRRDWDQLFVAGNRLDTEALRTFSAPSVAYLKKLYDSEIRRVDTAYGRLRDRIHARGLDARTVTILTSDHGEAFGEDQFFYHGSCLHDPQLHIPLLFSLPGQREERRVPFTVGQCDIHPTLLALAGINNSAPGSGNSLLRRSGEVIHQNHRSVLSSLDLHRSDPETWQFRLTRGAFRASGAGPPGSVLLAERGNEPEARQFDLLNVQTLPEGDARKAAEDFHLERHFLGECANKIPLPGWRQAEDFNPEAFRAMGYL